MLENPYARRGTALFKGNLHLHCSESSGCSSVALEESVRRYSERGYGFIAVTDHDRVTGLEGVRAAFPEITLMSGCEYSTPRHLVCVGEALPDAGGRPTCEDLLRNIDGTLAFCSHPDGPEEGYWTAEAVAKLPGIDGIEIYNGHYGLGEWRRKGAGWEYTSLWDEVLTRGVRLWGFANDDFHDSGDMGNAANHVFAASRAADEVIAALKGGAFYASSGLELGDIEESGGRISVSMGRRCSGRFIGPGGAVLKQEKGERFEYEHSGEAYVRFEAEHNGQKMWLQPLFNAPGKGGER
ncbi:MAG TPA: hypothetical protein ENN09_02310 [Planctomycetes bacterium]|nr:hypothetical protein [Planctomycetota bacterium]